MFDTFGGNKNINEFVQNLQKCPPRANLSQFYNEQYCIQNASITKKYDGLTMLKSLSSRCVIIFVKVY